MVTPLCIRTFYSDIDLDDCDAAFFPIDDGDDGRDRYDALKKIFSGRDAVHAIAYPAPDLDAEDDEYHVFFSDKPIMDGNIGIFGCIIVSQKRLAEMLASQPTVSESFGFRVGNGKWDLNASVIRWAHESFGFDMLPKIDLARYTEKRR